MRKQCMARIEIIAVGWGAARGEWETSANPAAILEPPSSGTSRAGNLLANNIFALRFRIMESLLDRSNRFIV
jgi:hypothetical protein